MSSQRVLRDGLGVAGLLFAAYLFVVVAPQAGTVGFDAFPYWNVDLEHPYARVAGEFGAFTYTPVAARLFAPASLLSWPAFWFAWTAVLVGTMAWLGWRRTLLVLAFPPVALELYHGNIHLLLAAAIGLGLRYPWTWAFVLLTKVTPGVGILWFAVRREWRSLAIAVGVTAGLAAASFALRPDWWADWVGLITRDQGNAAHQLPYVRYAVAAAIVVWGARTDRPWTVPLGACLALPVVYPDSFTFLLGCVAVRYTWIRRAALGDRARDAAGSGAARGLGAATGSGGGAVG